MDFPHPLPPTHSTQPCCAGWMMNGRLSSVCNCDLIGAGDHNLVELLSTKYFDESVHKCVDLLKPRRRVVPQKPRGHGRRAAPHTPPAELTTPTDAEMARHSHSWVPEDKPHVQNLRREVSLVRMPSFSRPISAMAHYWILYVQTPRYTILTDLSLSQSQAKQLAGGASGGCGPQWSAGVTPTAENVCVST